MLPRLPRGSTGRPSRARRPPPCPPHCVLWRGRARRAQRIEGTRNAHTASTWEALLTQHRSAPSSPFPAQVQDDSPRTLGASLDTTWASERTHTTTQMKYQVTEQPHSKTIACFIARPSTTKNMSHYKRTRTINPQSLQHPRRAGKNHDKLELTGRANSNTNEGEVRPTQGRAETRP